MKTSTVLIVGGIVIGGLTALYFVNKKKQAEREEAAANLQAELEVRKWTSKKEDNEDLKEDYPDEELTEEEALKAHLEDDIKADLLMTAEELDEFDKAPIKNEYIDLYTDEALRDKQVVESIFDKVINVEELEEDEEDDILRFDPNSRDALIQYRNMLFSDITNEEIRDLMCRLFEHMFIPKTKEDKELYSLLVEDRTRFFKGDSRWNMQVTWADLFVHFANKATFHFDGTFEEYLDNWLDNAKIVGGVGEATMFQRLSLLQEHQYYSNKGFGLFGIDEVHGESKSFTDQFDRWMEELYEVLSEDADELYGDE